jgi:hypothetical protein
MVTDHKFCRGYWIVRRSLHPRWRVRTMTAGVVKIALIYGTLARLLRQKSLKEKAPWPSI